jgi:hypothetical protein
MNDRLAAGTIEIDLTGIWPVRARNGRNSDADDSSAIPLKS